MDKERESNTQRKREKKEVTVKDLNGQRRRQKHKDKKREHDLKAGFKTTMHDVETSI